MLEILVVGGAYAVFFGAIILVAFALGLVLKVTVFAPDTSSHNPASPSVRAHRQRIQR